MILSHKIELKPNKKQEEYFIKAAGTARFVYNWGLAEWKRQYAEGGKPSENELRRYFNSLKYQEFPWLKEMHRDSHSQPFKNLGNAFKKFFKKQGKYPKFKKLSSGRSFYLANEVFSVGEKYIKFPKIGKVRAKQSLRFEGKIMSATVSQDADRWFISVSVEMPEYRKERNSDGIVGIDLGLNSLLTLSNGDKVEAAKPLKKHLKKLKRLSKKLSRKQKESESRKKARLRLAKLHRRIKRIRLDQIHKITTKICCENQTIVIEDLSVKNMIKNRRLSRHISDVAWGEIKRQLEYKTQIYKGKLVVANRFYPSSKTCSRCGNVKENLKLSERFYKCDECGLEIDRDLNAAINLSTLGYRGFQAGGEGSSGDEASPHHETILNETGTFELWER